MLGEAGRPGPGSRASTPGPAAALSVLLSAAAAVAVGCVCAFVYPVVRELRAQRVRGDDGTEEKMLGFWSISVLSVVVGCVCCIFSWTLTYIDSYQPGVASSEPPAPALSRYTPGRGSHVGCGVAVLNGVLATLTAAWSLS